jgi:hypothetical protein
MPISLFLFAHQDDECAVLQTIMNAVSSGHRVCCAYLTSGAVKGMPFEHRNKESLNVLGKLGVKEQDIFFVGNALDVPDAGLPSKMEAVANWLKEWLSVNINVENLFVPAFEGGHHDHDAVHAIGVVIGMHFGLGPVTRQFPLYNGYRCFGPFFRVMYPIPVNGPIFKVYIPWGNRFRFMRYCLSYPSQAMTWVGLFPFVFLRYLIYGTELSQPVSKIRLLEKPHAQLLYYERRGFYIYKTMRQQIESLVRLYG